ncbi:hypothetical protein WJX81_004590 [Elliptochloris bilobata]|uniref:Asl1-like glycosyl hydrolase catalytic domain-containing protein n=1 Tax=Elliptochloris bilobata TaxID=381761 RepID=A0AAW1RM82_9CHLO
MTGFGGHAVLATLHLQGNRFVPLKPSVKLAREARKRHDYDENTDVEDSKHQRYFSLTVTWERLLQHIASDVDMEEDQWACIFEDDITLHDDVSHAVAREAILHGMDLARSDGLLYLGGCSPDCSFNDAAEWRGELSFEKSLAAVNWPTDSQLRASLLQKRGLALYGDDNLEKLAKMKAYPSAVNTGISWLYDYSFGNNGPLMEACFEAGVEYMPIIGHNGGLFGVGTNNLTEVFSIRTFPSNTRHILGFNEPNDPNQGNMTAELAAANWPLVEAVAAHYKLSIVSPVPSKCSHEDCFNQHPFTWWDHFFANCTIFFNRTCRVDVMAVHYYVPCDIGYMKQFIDQVKTRYSRPVMVTGWGCWNATASVRHAATFMRQAMAIMDDDPRVLRYAWWTPLPSQEGSYDMGTGPNALYYGEGNATYLSPLGKIYMEQLCPATSLAA